MQLMLIALVIIVTAVITLSFFVIRYASHKPANGELKQLKRLDTKLEENKKYFNIVKDQTIHYVH